MLLSPGVKAVGPPLPTPSTHRLNSLPASPSNHTIISSTGYLQDFSDLFSVSAADTLLNVFHLRHEATFFQATQEKTNKVTPPLPIPRWGSNMSGKHKQRHCSTTSSQLMLASSQADSTNMLMVRLVHLQTLELDFTTFQQHNQEVVVSISPSHAILNNIFAIFSGNTSTQPLLKWLSSSQQ